MLHKRLSVLLVLTLMTLPAACGGPGDSPSSPTPPPGGAVTRAADTAIIALDFSSPERGWAVSGTHQRVVLSTTGDGETWHGSTLPVRGRPTDVEFVDGIHGWVAVEAGGSDAGLAILRTSDGGRSWRRTAIADVSTYEGGFSFTGPREGWLVGAQADDPRLPVALRTRDGGATWHRVHVADGLITLTSVVFQEPPLRGWVSGYDNQHVGTPARAFTTADGGRSWTAAEGGDLPKTGLFKVDDTHVWSLGEADDRLRMLRWDAATDVWEAVDASGDVPDLFAFASADLGWGVRLDTGEEGVVVGWELLRTEDGGRTWAAAGVDIPAQPTAICCPDEEHAVVATDDGSVVTVGR
jgi:photosystem II stability/assembly factor-like uncharacterized protein